MTSEPVPRVRHVDGFIFRHYICRMAPHPSLGAPTNRGCQIKLGNNGPTNSVGVRSGKKLQVVPFRRDQQKPINIFEIESKMIAELRRGYCSHPEPGGTDCLC